MEVSRKNYSKIIGILKKGGVSAEKSIELSDAICELLEDRPIDVTSCGEEPYERIDYMPLQKAGHNFVTTPISSNTNENQGKRTFKPGEKVPGGYINGSGKFVPTFLDKGRFSKEEEELFTALNER